MTIRELIAVLTSLPERYDETPDIILTVDDDAHTYKESGPLLGVQIAGNCLSFTGEKR